VQESIRPSSPAVSLLRTWERGRNGRLLRAMTCVNVSKGKATEGNDIPLFLPTVLQDGVSVFRGHAPRQGSLTA
jgi:hypothetical protein